MLAGQEHHDEVGGGVETRPVGLVGERLNVPAQQPRMVAQVPLALLLVAGLVGIEYALQRRLGVDDDMLAAGQVDDQVGTQRRLIAGDRRLLGEVAVPDHPGELDHVAELHLTPLSAGVRLAQRGHERAGLGSETLAGVGKRLQLSLEPPARLPPLLIEMEQLGVDPAELLLERGHELLDRLPARVEISSGLGPGGVQLGAVELGQLVDARLQRVGAQRLERDRQPLLGVGQRRQTFLGQHTLVLEVRSGTHELTLDLAGARGLDRQRPQPGTDRQQDRARAGNHTDEQPQRVHGTA